MPKRQVMVRYRVRPECAEENAQLIERVFEALERAAPEGLHYASFRLDDGVSFVHIVTQDDAEDRRLRDLPEFRAFTAGIQERCEEQPVSVALHTVGAYQLPA